MTAMNYPRITVITVCCNSAATIEATLMSVVSQTYSNIEHIIVDGNSTDETLGIIMNYQNKTTKVISEKDNGIYDAMNKGLVLSTGDIIGFLNADDIYASNDILKKVASVFTDQTVDACYGDLVYTEYNDLSKIIRYWKSCEYSDGLFSKGWSPPHPTFFVRASVYKKLGGFDLQYPIGNDIELMMRFLGKNKIKSVYIPEVLVKMRIGGISNNSIMNIIKQNIEVMRAARNNNIPISSLSFVIHKIKSRIIQRFRRI